MRKKFLIFFIITISLIFTIRLFSLQILNPDFEKLSQNNAVLAISEYPERGLIFDRNKKLIVGNEPTFDLLMVPENVYAFDTILLTKILKVEKKIIVENINKANKFSKRLPSVIISEIPKNQYAIFQEHMWKFNGFFIQKRSNRNYKIPIASNILGYISEVNSNDLKNDSYYKTGELIGRQGIEKTYEKLLRGTKGKKFLQKDRFNRIIGPYNNGVFDIKKQRAENLILTIDSDLQLYGEKLMKNKRGGIVAIEPKTGEILALITSPSYNPNLLVGKKRSINYKMLLTDSISKPLFDRGLQALYPPGSPFKLVNGLIGLQEKVITKNTQFKCNKGHFYARGSFMECLCGDNLRKKLHNAIYKSCNTYFAKTFTRIISDSGKTKENLNNWKKHVESFGFGNYLGYDLPIGKKGFIPNSDYYDKIYAYQNWNSTTIISNSIGQGEILTTPIQLANLAAIISNRGYYYKPHFLKSERLVNSQYTEKIVTSIDSLNYEIIIDGMRDVVEKGTAKIAKINNIEICGKTGTAENFTLIDNIKTQLTDHSIFIAFAPKDDPKIALAVFVENGYWGSRWAAPIGSLAIEKYLNKDVNRKWLEAKIMNGSLENEYMKVVSGRKFKINE